MFYVYESLVCMYVGRLCVASVYRGQKRMLGPLKVVVSFLVLAMGTEVSPLRKQCSDLLSHLSSSRIVLFHYVLWPGD